MKIKNIDGLSAEDLQQEVNQGGKFVFYLFTISLVIVTFKKTSGVYLVRGGKHATAKRTICNIVSLLFGWWGIPFGPKFTLESIRTNMKGGKDVTDEVMATVAGHMLFKETKKQKAINQ